MLPAMKLEFNHAMVYVSDVARARQFYVDRLGFRVLEEADGFYARLRSPNSTTTVALHQAEPGVGGIRLYFESKKLDELCAQLAREGVKFDKPPQDMPWGWRHTYLRDPDGHEISLYYAGSKRLQGSPPATARSPRKQKTSRSKGRR